MYSVKQTIYSTRKAVTRILNEEETKQYLIDHPEMEKRSETSYFHAYSAADVYLDLCETKEQVTNTYSELIKE